MNFNRLTLLATSALALMVTVSAWGGPGLINYQGRLVNAEGEPITAPVNVTFSFYDAETGGNQIGTFLDMDTVTPNSDGLYATLIGDDPGNLVPDSIFTRDNVWINVNYNGEDLLPRKRVTSVGYAYCSTSTVKNMLYNFVVGASQAVSAGDVVALLNDGTIERGSGSSFGAASIFATGSFNEVSAAVLSANKFVVVFKDIDNGNFGTAMIADINGYTITFGPKQVFSDNRSTDWPAVTALSSTRIVVSYTDTNHYSWGAARVGQVEGDTITFGTLEYTGSSTPQHVSAATVGEGKFVIAWCGGYAGNQAVVGEASGETDLTFHTPRHFGSYSSDWSAIAPLSDNKCLIAYRSMYGQGGFGIIADASGDLTFGPEAQFSYYPVGSDFPAALSPNTVAMTYIDYYNNTGHAMAVLGQVAGDELTWGSSLTVSSNYCDSPTVAALSPTSCLITYDESSTPGGMGGQTTGKALIAGVSGDTLVLGSPATFSSPNTYIPWPLALGGTEYALLYMFNSNSTNCGKALIGFTDQLNQPSANAFGVADSAAAAGETVPVILEGISDHHSGLLPGTPYYANPDGSLTTVNSGAPVGRAISPTKLLLGFGR